LGTQANPLTTVFSLYGQYVLPRGGEVWIGSLIQALGALDYTAATVRAIVSRMQRRGYLQSRRQGRRSFYRLTDRGQKEVRWGSAQAFASPAAWDGRWTVITYFVPEARREHRDLLRASLAGLGFGALAPGVWLSPHLLSSEAEPKWRERGVWDYLEIFRAEYLGPGDSHTLTARAWPHLPALADRYRAYVAGHEPLLHRLEAGDLSDKESFAARFRSLFEYVAITLEDPGLPPALLSDDWPRPAAESLFEQLHQALTGPAERFFDSIYQAKGVPDDQRNPS